jgi:hypothetical protein
MPISFEGLRLKISMISSPVVENYGPDHALLLPLFSFEQFQNCCGILNLLEFFS